MNSAAHGAPQVFACGWHPEIQVKVGSEGCPECIEWLTNTPESANPVYMTPRQREGELKLWMERPLSVRFGLLWPRLDALVGRPTYNSEWADPDHLYREAASGKPAKNPGAEALKSLRRVAPDKPIVAVVTDA